MIVHRYSVEFLDNVADGDGGNDWVDRKVSHSNVGNCGEIHIQSDSFFSFDGGAGADYIDVNFHFVTFTSD